MSGDFDKWFKAQHGPRKKWAHSDDGLQRVIDMGLSAQDEKRRREQWDARYQSALYGFNFALRREAQQGGEVSDVR